MARLEMLKLAFDIVDSSAQRVVYYIDVGSMTKPKAEEHIEAVKTKCAGNAGEIWIPCSENDRRSEVVILSGKVTLDSVMKTATALRQFVENK